jgi:hypothetical protein
MGYLTTPAKGLLSFDPAPCCRQTLRDWKIRNQIPRWLNSLGSRALDGGTRLCLPACHASASSAEGDGLRGNLFS